jgi:hypothetical protein
VLLTIPAPAGLTDQATAALKLPVPFTVAVHLLVCAGVMDAGEQVTATEVMVGPATLTVAEPDLVASSVDVAVMVGFAALFSEGVGVKTPALLTVPELAGLTVQATAEL